MAGKVGEVTKDDANGSEGERGGRGSASKRYRVGANLPKRRVNDDNTLYIYVLALLVLTSSFSWNQSVCQQFGHSFLGQMVRTVLVSFYYEKLL